MEASLYYLALTHYCTWYRKCQKAAMRNPQYTRGGSGRGSSLPVHAFYIRPPKSREKPGETGSSNLELALPSRTPAHKEKARATWTPPAVAPALWRAPCDWPP